MTPEALLSIEHDDNAHLAELVELAAELGFWTIIFSGMTKATKFCEVTKPENRIWVGEGPVAAAALAAALKAAGGQNGG